MNAFHALLKVLLGIALLCAIPFVIEILLGAYETNRNPWTQPGAIVADGGPVRAGRGYWVGEEGPEFIRPKMNGYVSPAGDVAGGVTVVVQNMSVRDEMDIRLVAKELAEYLGRRK